MTDYLEEHLGNAEALLKRVQQLEQSVSGLTGRAAPGETADHPEAFGKGQDTGGKNGRAAESRIEVHDMETEVNQVKEAVDRLDTGLEIREKERDAAVNRQARADDNGRDLEQIRGSSQGKEAQTNAERAESPLSVQLEELDRAVSALTTLIPEGRRTAQDGYPVSLPNLRSPAADPAVTGAPGEGWAGFGAAVRADSTYGGAQSWAEQADQMFRRDSRRYDGGFYLY